MSKSNMLKPAAFNAFKEGYKAKYGKVTESAKLFNTMRFDADNNNVSFENYINTKLDTLNKNIDNY